LPDFFIFVLMYFQPPYTKDNVHKQFRTLSKTMHPDAGGSTAEFQKMQDEYLQVNKIIEALPMITRKAVKKKKKKAKVQIVHIHINLKKIMMDDIINAILKKM
jgi:hypothetical protein